MQFIFNASILIQTEISNGILNIFNSLFKFILTLIDKKRVYHTEQVINQEEIAHELEILINVSAVKEDALQRGTWTPNHSMTMSHLSQRLYSECDWSSDKIHDYMRKVVESLGLVYVNGNDEDDDNTDDGKISIGS
jgi:hypothetical protein